MEVKCREKRQGVMKEREKEGMEERSKDGRRGEERGR
jgi:hypothetical protein